MMRIKWLIVILSITLSGSIRAERVRSPVRIAVCPLKKNSQTPWLDAAFRDMIKSFLETSNDIYVCPLKEQRQLLDKLENPTPLILKETGVDIVIRASVTKNAAIAYHITSRNLPQLATTSAVGEETVSITGFQECAFKIAHSSVKPWHLNLDRNGMALTADKSVLKRVGTILARHESATPSIATLKHDISSILMASETKPIDLREFYWLTQCIVNVLKQQEPHQAKAFLDQRWPKIHACAEGRQSVFPYLAELRLEAGQPAKALEQLEMFETYANSKDGMMYFNFKIPNAIRVALERKGDNLWTSNLEGTVVYVNCSRKRRRYALAYDIIKKKAIWKLKLPKDRTHFEKFLCTDTKVYYLTQSNVTVINKVTGRVDLRIRRHPASLFDSNRKTGIFINENDTTMILYHYGTLEKNGKGTDKENHIIEYVDLKAGKSRLLHQLQKRKKRSYFLPSHGKAGKIVYFSLDRNTRLAFNIDTGEQVNISAKTPLPKLQYRTQSIEPGGELIIKHGYGYYGYDYSSDASVIFKKSCKSVYEKKGPNNWEGITEGNSGFYIFRDKSISMLEKSTGKVLLKVPLKGRAYYAGLCTAGVLFTTSSGSLCCLNEKVVNVSRRLLHLAKFIKARSLIIMGQEQRGVTLLEKLTQDVGYQVDALVISAHAQARVKNNRRAWFLFNRFLSAMEGYVPRTDQLAEAKAILLGMDGLKACRSVEYPVLIRSCNVGAAVGGLYDNTLMLANPLSETRLNGSQSLYSAQESEGPAGAYICRDVVFYLSGLVNFKENQYNWPRRSIPYNLASKYKSVSIYDRKNGKRLWTRRLGQKNLMYFCESCPELNQLLWMEMTSRPDATTLCIASPDSSKPVTNIDLKGRLSEGTVVIGVHGKQWRRTCRPLFIQGTLATAALDGVLYAVDLAEKRVLWKQETQNKRVIGMTSSTVAIQNNDTVSFLDMKTGREMKTVTTGIKLSDVSFIRTYSNKVYLAAYKRFRITQGKIGYSNTLSCFCLDEKRMIWKTSPRLRCSIPESRPVLIDEDFLLIPFDVRHQFMVFDPKTGRKLGTADLPAPGNGAVTTWMLANDIRGDGFYKPNIGLDLVIKQASHLGTFGNVFYRFSDIKSFLSLCNFRPVRGEESISFATTSNVVFKGKSVVQKTVISPHHSPITGLAFGANGKLVSAERKGRVMVGTATPLAINAELKAFAHSAKQDMAVVSEKGGNIHMIDCQAGSVLKVHNIKTKGITALAIASSQPIIAYATLGKSITVMNGKTGARLTSITTGKLVRCMAFSPNGERVAIGDYNGNVLIVDVATGRITQTLRGHTFSVRDILFLPGKEQLVSASDDLTMRVWDLKSGKELRQLVSHDTLLVSLALNGDNLFCVDMEGTVSHWRVSSWKQLPSISTEIPGICGLTAFDTKRLAIGTRDGDIHFLSLP